MKRPAVFVTVIACGALCAAVDWLPAVAAQQAPRLNPMIAKLASGGAAMSGVDWTFVDLEHNPLEIDQFEVTLKPMGEKRRPNKEVDLKAAPIVRIPMDGDEPFKWVVKQILEIGAFGIVFPRVETKQQATTAIRAMRFKPQRGTKYPDPPGLRHVTPSKAARFWGLNMDDYIRRADVWPLNPQGELFAMVMIESVEGVANINEILDVPGIGAIFIGPNDLSMSVGVGRFSPTYPKETEAAIQTVLKACQAKKVFCGIQADGPERAKERVAQGFKVVLAGGG